MNGFYSQLFASKSLQITFAGETYSFSQIQQELENVELQLRQLPIRDGQMIFFRHENHLMHLLLFLLCEKWKLLFVPAFHDSSQKENESQLRVLMPEWVCRLEGGRLQIHAQSARSILREVTSGCLFQTSGTTGVAGYIVQTYESLLRNAQNASAGQEISSSSTVLSLLPFSHVGGLSMQTTAALLQGAHLVLEDRNHMTAICSRLQKATHSIIVPSYFHLLKSHFTFQATNFSNSPLIVTGSTVVTNSVFQEMEAKGFRVQAVYGLTEVGPYVCIAKSPAPLPHSCLSYLGRPEFSYKMRINPDNSEIQISGPCIGKRLNLSSGQLENLVNHDGFLETGDLGHFTNQNFFYLGRAKNIIIVGGYKVNPLEVEQKILEISTVQRCAVVGKPHPTLGEIAIAYVVGDAKDKNRIRKHLKQHLSRHKLPRQIHFVATLPETSIGKNHLYQIRQKAINDDGN